ncbi:MAG: hypothetical protein J6M16_01265 [Clostridia bacterium]|nr:hypothetical protein [Clostridia bacterium]
MNIISDILNGNINVLDNFGKRNLDIKKAETKIEIDYSNFIKTLSDSQKALSLKCKENQDRYELLLIEEAFSEGFRFAVKMMAEALAE